MRLKYRLLLILIVFVGILFINNSVFADYESKKDIPTTTPYYQYFYDDLSDNGDYLIFTFTSSNYSGNYLAVATAPRQKKDTFCFAFARSKTRNKTHLNYIDITTESSFLTGGTDCFYDIRFYEIEDNSVTYYSNILDTRYSSDYKFFDSVSILYASTKPVYYVDIDNGTYNGIGASGISDKINLYELNLTDMDYDNQEHLFNICTYTNSPCYNEIMDCYNRDLRYAIFVDDYTRTLTYGEENNDSSFMYGSYMLSGYIDYLIDDNAFFYYDNLTKSVEICHGKFGNSETYRTSILENSGDFSKSRKRFYFKLVYSEDSNDPDQVIWSDNGNLTLTKTNNDDAPPICFVGSSHNIPYTHYEKRNPIDVLWNTRRLVIDNSYYYVGYMGSGVHRDITSVPFYHYDFYFYGGTTKLFFANSSTFKEDKKKRYEELAGDYSKDGRQKDSSDGGSGVKGKGSSSSTYDRDKITDDSTQDELDDNSDGYRGFEKTDRDGENDEEDRTGFHFLNTLNKIKDKFNFVGNITKNANDIKDFVENTQETHKYYVNINHKYLNGNVCIIDLSWYAPYKQTVDAFICAFAYLAFIWHMFCKIPDLIHGASATTYVSDISSYINKR